VLAYTSRPHAHDNQTAIVILATILQRNSPQLAESDRESSDGLVSWSQVVALLHIAWTTNCVTASRRAGSSDKRIGMTNRKAGSRTQQLATIICGLVYLHPVYLHQVHRLLPTASRAGLRCSKPLHRPITQLGRFRPRALLQMAQARNG
jgi:hypothetical protein